MAVIPDSLKHEVSLEYELIYAGGTYESRRAANRYLDETARKYINKPAETKDKTLERVNIESKPPKPNPEPLLGVSDISASKSEDKPRKGFLDSLLDDVDKKYRGNNGA